MKLIPKNNYVYHINEVRIKVPSSLYNLFTCISGCMVKATPTAINRYVLK